MDHPAKLALVALAWILVAGYSDATADDLLDLGTRDLVRMKTVSGITLAFDPGKITMVYALPRPGSPRGNAPITNVVGLAGGPQEIDETVDGLLERLDLKPYFIALTLPDGVRVWLKASRGTGPYLFGRPTVEVCPTFGTLIGKSTPETSARYLGHPAASAAIPGALFSPSPRALLPCGSVVFWVPDPSSPFRPSASSATLVSA